MKHLALLLACLGSLSAQTWQHQAYVRFDGTATANHYGAFKINQVSTPAAPGVTVVGTTGATTCTYKIVANDALGSTIGSAGTSVGNCNATLNATNYNVVTWTFTAGATTYSVYRTAGGPSTGKIATQSGPFSINDTGLAGDGSATPATNTTGYMSATQVCLASGACVVDYGASALPVTCPAGTLAVNSSSGAASCVAADTWYTLVTYINTGFSAGTAYGYTPNPIPGLYFQRGGSSPSGACSQSGQLILFATISNTSVLNSGFVCKYDAGSGTRAWQQIADKAYVCSSFTVGCTGSGLFVGQTAPALITPDIGVATGTSLNLGSGDTVSKFYTLTATVDCSGVCTVNANTCSQGDFGAVLNSGDKISEPNYDVQFTNGIQITWHTVGTHLWADTCNPTTGNVTDSSSHSITFKVIR